MGAACLDQQVLVEVADPAAGLHLGEAGCWRAVTPVSVQVHDVLLRDGRELLGAGLLLPRNWTDGYRWRTSRQDGDRDRTPAHAMNPP